MSLTHRAARGWVVVGLLGAAFGGPAVSGEDPATETVHVIRGSTTSRVTSEELYLPDGTREYAVVELRPESGSFLRETKRLAANAQAREHAAAAAFARGTDRQLAEALTRVVRAVEARHHPDPAGWVVGMPWIRHDPGRLKSHKALAPVRSSPDLP